MSKPTILQYFKTDRTPDQKMAAAFEDLAEQIHELPAGEERTIALRKLLEVKDVVVRASLG